MANNIAFFRERAGLTQGELAKLLELRLSRPFDQSKISKLENTPNPNLQLVVSVKEALNESLLAQGKAPITLDDLMTEAIPTLSKHRKRILALCSEKGGVGKSTLSYNIACYFALQGQRTVLVDLDSQRNSTKALVDAKKIRHTIWTLFSEYSPEEPEHFHLNDFKLEPEYESLRQNLRVVPAHRQLSRAEKHFSFEDSFAIHILKQAIDRDEEADVYILDCPGNPGILTLNALVAANEILVPALVGMFETDSIVNTQDTFATARRFNPDFRVRGIIFNKFRERTKIASRTQKTIESLGYPIFRTRIPLAVTIAEAAEYQRPVFEYDPKGQGGKAMRALVEEVYHA